MTKCKIEIKENYNNIEKEEKDGAYVATFTSTNDRILFFRCGELVAILENDSGNFNIQHNKSVNYRNLKKIKKLEIEVIL